MDIVQPKKFKVLLVGDSCIDEYRIGRVDRISPEAPVPVVKIVNQFQVPGMAANVKLNLFRLGIDVDFVTNGGVITKTRYIDNKSGQQLLRVDDEPEIVPWSRKTPFPIHEYDLVVVSDYDKGFLTYDSIRYLVEVSLSPVFIDTKKKDLAYFGNDDRVYVKVNSTEAKLARSNPTNLIVTLGSKGARYKDTIYPTTKVDLVDVCGAGDTFLAGLVYSYLYTNSITDSIIFANKAAAITVKHVGVYAPTIEEILGDN